MDSNEVIVHNNDRIHNFLCGNHQILGSNLNKQKSNISFYKENTDFSQYPFPEPIDPSRYSKLASHTETSNNNSTNDNSVGFDQRIKMKEFNKLKKEESMINNIDNYLSMYDINTKRKKIILHQDLENHYFQPLSDKLVKKTRGKEYEKYLKAKTRAVTAFDNQTRTKDTFSKDLPDIPSIKFDLSDLSDPVVKYRVNAQKEKDLTTLIQKSNGEWKNPETFPERDTMNLKKWKILSETRFYDGNYDPNSPNSLNSTKGKKINPAKFSSNVKSQIDNFAPPVVRPTYVARKKMDYQIDHIKFDQ